MQFKELELPPDLQRGLDEAGYITCMPIQEMVFAHSFKGADIYAQSQTGTGKTAAFLVSIFQRILCEPDLGHRKALILAPTRELAVQIQEEADRLGKYLGIKIGAFYGGVGYGPQLDLLKDDVQFIIGTPGRITDLLQQGKMKLNEVGFLVIDEADRMFDMGFVDDLRRLLRYLPQASRRQTFLFSATLGLRVKDLAWEYMDKPTEIVIEPEHVTVELATQELYHVGSHEKFRLLLGLLGREKPKSAIIFCNQKNMVEELARRLHLNGIECDYIMGDLPQSKRLSIINNLKEGRLEILVATDVAARGLDIDALDLVVNYDVPNEAESYVHRIGRTARAGKSGKALTLACEKFVYGLPAVEKFIGFKIPVLSFGEDLLPEDKSSRLQYHRGRDKPAIDRRAGERRGPEHHGVERRPLERRAPDPHRRSPDQPFRKEGARLPEREAPRPDLRKPFPAAARLPATSERREEVQGAQNPYTVPQDERMRIYRQKYSSGEQSEKGIPGVKSPNAPAPGPAAMPPRAPSSVQRSPLPAAGKPEPVTGGPSAPPPELGRKSGILSRIKSLFVKKD
jgi:ATP-dependent RNA helicase RhlB